MATHDQNGAKPQWRPAAARLREMLNDSEKIVVCPGIYDGLTARIALQVGFDCLYMTGAGTSAARMGSADLGLITLTEMHANADMIASLDPSVPLIADADTGFGAPLSVARTVRKYIDSNVAGLHIEDQTSSKRCGHLKNKQLASLDEFVVRIRAAARARKEAHRDIVLIARTDSLQSLGFDEAVRRLKAAVEAGADAVFLEGFATKEQGKEICRIMAPTPCLINVVERGLTPTISAEEAKQLGFKIQIWPIVALTAVYNSTKEAMEELKQMGIKKPVPGGAGGIRDIFGVCGIDDFTRFDIEVGNTAYREGV
jgi:2-methylisocitrate lyase-like PEP mutase family enzyme